MARLNIPEKVKIQVWTEAAGRCQFRGCNKALWRNELTLSQTNFSEMAHIIGASEDGPRGNDESDDLAIDPENLMLLCRDHHKEIDDSTVNEKYTVEYLNEMKQEHINRVRMLLNQPSKRSRPLVLSSLIGGQSGIFGVRSITSALLPDYPDKPFEDWITIEIGSFERKNMTEWEVAAGKIQAELESLKRGVDKNIIEHVSVFGLAPQPLLMYLGLQLGDKITARIFEPRRTEDQDKKWLWSNDDSSDDIEFNSSCIKNGTTNDVVLLIAISDFLQEDKYSGMVLEGHHVYSLTVETPVQGGITKESEKASFIRECRFLLNKIQSEVGRDCTIHVLPAMSASLSIEFGRLIQPTKDPAIIIYENVDKTIPRKIIELTT